MCPNQVRSREWTADDILSGAVIRLTCRLGTCPAYEIRKIFCKQPVSDASSSAVGNSHWLVTAGARARDDHIDIPAIAPTLSPS